MQVQSFLRGFAPCGKVLHKSRHIIWLHVCRCAVHAICLLYYLDRMLCRGTAKDALLCSSAQKHHLPASIGGQAKWQSEAAPVRGHASTVLCLHWFTESDAYEFQSFLIFAWQIAIASQCILPCLGCLCSRQVVPSTRYPSCATFCQPVPCFFHPCA